jgi:hypothetical protein
MIKRREVSSACLFLSMIRISSIVICSLLISATATFGQSSGIGWGIKGGLNTSGVQTDNTLVLQNNTKLGWQLGVFSKTVVEGWGYLAEANIMTLGSKQVVGSESQNNTVGYLSIPLALQYSTNNNWSFILGGYASFRLWAKRKSTTTGAGDTEANIKDNVAFIDYGVLAGVSYTYQRIIFDLRYLQGIPNINTNSTINARVNNASSQFSIGYFLK